MAYNPFEAFQKQVEAGAKLLNLEPHVIEMLKWPKKVLEVRFPVTMDDGRVIVFTGWRSQHNDALGPTKGGIRYHWDVTKEEVMALSGWMTFKNATAGLPYGGGKGGIRFRDNEGNPIHPKELSDAELERISRAFVDAIYQIIGPEKDIPAPDVYTNPKIMGWMTDEFSKLRGYWAPGVFTGKPLTIGGSKGRGTATARGGFFVLREALKAQGKSFDGLTAAVQGFGNAGSYAALFLYEAGVKVVAVSDSKGGIFNGDGLNIPEVMKFKKEHGTVVGFPGAEKITNEELLELDVDVLVPAALENQIRADNAENIKAKIILELANGPTTPEADEILYKKGIMVIPDILANSGGVTVSYFEWVQNITGYYWTEEEVDQKLDRKMSEAFKAVYDAAKEFGVDLRKGAYVNAIRRVVAAMRDRGWIK